MCTHSAGDLLSKLKYWPAVCLHSSLLTKLCCFWIGIGLFLRLLACLSSKTPQLLTLHVQNDQDIVKTKWHSGWANLYKKRHGPVVHTDDDYQNSGLVPLTSESLKDLKSSKPSLVSYVYTVLAFRFCILSLNVGRMANWHHKLAKKKVINSLQKLVL